MNQSKLRNMKNRIVYMALFGVLLAWACSNDDDLSPSLLDENWYVLTDSEDPLDHLRYELFETYGIPVFYNDTIGEQERGVDNVGEPIIYYEVLNPNYSIESSTEYAQYVLSCDREAITDGVEFIRDYVLPKLASNRLYPRSYLLVDTLTLNATGSYPYEAGVYRGMMTTCVGNIEMLLGMSAGELERLACEIAAEEYATYLTENASSLLETFYNVSRSEINGLNLYSQSLTAFSEVPYVENLEEYGFLSYEKGAQYNPSSSRVTTINERADVADYVTEVLLEDDETFEAMYGSYEYVMRKYRLMKTVLEDLNVLLQ